MPYAEGRQKHCGLSPEQWRRVPDKVLLPEIRRSDPSGQAWFGGARKRLEASDGHKNEARARYSLSLRDRPSARHPRLPVIVRARTRDTALSRQPAAAPKPHAHQRNSRVQRPPTVSIMPARPSFIRAATAGEDQEDPYTRSPITLESRRARAARRLSMASTIFTIGPNKGKDAGPAPRTMPAPLNIARCVIYGASSFELADQMQALTIHSPSRRADLVNCCACYCHPLE